jgi:hypothetical protein
MYTLSLASQNIMGTFSYIFCFINTGKNVQWLGAKDKELGQLGVFIYSTKYGEARSYELSFPSLSATWNHSKNKKLALHPIPLLKSLKSIEKHERKGSLHGFFGHLWIPCLIKQLWYRGDQLARTLIIAVDELLVFFGGFSQAWSTPNHWLKIVENRNRQNQQRSIKLG